MFTVNLKSFLKNPIGKINRTNTSETSATKKSGRALMHSIDSGAGRDQSQQHMLTQLTYMSEIHKDRKHTSLFFESLWRLQVEYRLVQGT